MPTIDLTEEERAALADVAREYVRTQRYYGKRAEIIGGSPFKFNLPTL